MIPIPPIAIKAIAGLAIVGIAYGAGWLQANKANQNEYEAQLSRQIAKAAQSQYESAEATAKIEADYQRKLRDQAATRVEVVKEVITYVKSPAKKCPVSVELEHAHDAVTSLHDIVPSPDSVSASSGPSSQPTEPPAGGLQDAPGDPGRPLDDSVMLEAYAAVLEEYSSLWNAYDSLRGWVTVNYQLQVKAMGHGEE